MKFKHLIGVFVWTIVFAMMVNGQNILDVMNGKGADEVKPKV